MENSFEQRYREGAVPWDHGQPDHNLINIVERFGIEPCRVLDIGCGTGDNAIWLSDNGFEVSGCDLSETAIRMAKEKGGAAPCDFRVADILDVPFEKASFDFVFDRGCFHSMRSAEDKEHFVRCTKDVLSRKGLWLSLIGNADEPPRDVGPPQISARELTACIEPHFEFILIEAGFFGGEQEAPPRAWVCLMRKRAD